MISIKGKNASKIGASFRTYMRRRLNKVFNKAVRTSVKYIKTHSPKRRKVTFKHWDIEKEVTIDKLYYYVSNEYVRKGNFNVAKWLHSENYFFPRGARPTSKATNWLSESIKLSKRSYYTIGRNLVKTTVMEEFGK